MDMDENEEHIENLKGIKKDCIILGAIIMIVLGLVLTKICPFLF